MVIKLTLYVLTMVSCDKNEHFYHTEPQDICAESHISQPS